MVRALPGDYGFELHEFDPFFNYRATQFIVENGFSAYFEWNDELSWYPYGRDVSATSQVMLHITAATLYKIFGAGYCFCTSKNNWWYNCRSFCFVAL